MRKNHLLRPIVGILVLFCFVAAASAEVRLPSMFSDHMVLQRDVPLPVWGWADPGEKVTVTLDDLTQEVVADAGGKWSLKLPAMKAGGPFQLQVGGTNSIAIDDVLVGEVWLGSGQSNMEMAVNGVMNKDAELAASDDPQIRMFTVAKKTAEEPQLLCKGQWYVSGPNTTGRFSATAYFFAREIHKQLNVPVGIIHSSWGGTRIQTWIGMDAFTSVPELRSSLDWFNKQVATYDPQVAQEKFEKAMAQWQKSLDAATDDAKRIELNNKKPKLTPNPRTDSSSPSRLYNGMITPLVPYAIRGALWYQGESNAGEKNYGVMLRTMIGQWRRLWNQGDFPFLFVQLPNYKAPQVSPSESVSGWMRSREMFLQSLAVPNTGMAVTIDIGDAEDIHPKNKQEVGRRLAQWALNKTYGKDVVPGGPLYKSMRVDGDKVIIEFDYLGGGLAARDNAKLKGFAIAGEDKKFVWADAEIIGDTVVVSNAEVSAPAAVRYAWAINPDCDLINKAGLPASPFRTDDWE